MNAWWCERAWVGDRVLDRVSIEVNGQGLIERLAPDTEPGSRGRLKGLVFPGFANAHSHAFHRALRGRTHHEGSFWQWRESMYRLASRLDPDSYRELATAVFAEMVLAGYTAVGEFHYLHHRAGGHPYDDRNAMGLALIEAARAAGIRLTLLDVCYLTGGIGQPREEGQARFGDRDATAWSERFTSLPESPELRIGAALHSVRAVPAVAIPVVVAAAIARPLHFHLSEQPDENAQCLAAYGMTPTQLLSDNGALGPNSTAVHAIHVSETDIGLLGDSGTSICVCPTTERDLGDGIGPTLEMSQAGCPLSLGSDQHAVIDPFEEMRGLEVDQRLRNLHRGFFSQGALVLHSAADGYRALGWDGGTIAVGHPCDLVAIDLESIRTAGVDPTQAVMAATASDVHTVIVGGEAVVADRRHRLGDVAARLGEAINPLWD
jgi:formiminoglutamate deiminase